MVGKELEDDIFLAGALFCLYKLGPVNIMKVR